MARIVVATWGSYGDLFPALGLAVELKRRGHDVVVATCGFYRERVQAEGLGFHPVPPDIDPNDKAFIARVMDPLRGSELLLGEVLAPATRASYAAIDAAAEGADLLVSHPATFAAPLVARKRGLPWVSMVLAPLSFFSRHDFPVLPIGAWTRHLDALGPWICAGVRRVAQARSRQWVEPVVQLRRELGLPDDGHPLFEGQFSPHGTLALFPSVLAEPQPDWPPHVTRGGFVSYNGPDPMPPALLDFLASGPPPVTFTLGTSAVGAPGRFFTEAAAACGELGIRGVLLVGRDPENQPRRALPQGVMAIEYAPHAALFPRSAAVVHQAGMGTTSQALRAGKPQLIVPHAHDQPDNARRVNRLGVARVCQPRHFVAPAVAASLASLLAPGAHHSRAEAVGERVRQEDGAATACDVLEAVVRNR